MPNDLILGAWSTAMEYICGFLLFRYTEDGLKSKFATQFKVDQDIWIYSRHLHKDLCTDDNLFFVFWATQLSDFKGELAQGAGKGRGLWNRKILSKANEYWSSVGGGLTDG